MRAHTPALTYIVVTSPLTIWGLLAPSVTLHTEHTQSQLQPIYIWPDLNNDQSAEHILGLVRPSPTVLLEARPNTASILLFSLLLTDLWVSGTRSEEDKEDLKTSKSYQQWVEVIIIIVVLSVNFRIYLFSDWTALRLLGDKWRPPHRHQEERETARR